MYLMHDCDDERAEPMNNLDKYDIAAQAARRLAALEGMAQILFEFGNKPDAFGVAHQTTVAYIPAQVQPDCWEYMPDDLVPYLQGAIDHQLGFCDLRIRVIRHGLPNLNAITTSGNIWGRLPAMVDDLVNRSRESDEQFVQRQMAERGIQPPEAARR